MLITDVVLAETVWTRTGRRYHATRVDLIDLVNNLLQDANLYFEDDEVVWSALHAPRSTEADFVDALIVCKAEKQAAEGGVLCTVYTFDDVATQLPGTTRL